MDNRRLWSGLRGRLTNRLRSTVQQVLIRLAPSRMGFAIVPKGLGYFDAEKVLQQAEAAGLPLVEYLESSDLGGVGRRREDVIDALRGAGVFEPCDTVLEIGAGTGIYLERTIELCRPQRCEVYETNPGWVRYLRRHLAGRVRDLRVQDADGLTLRQTADASVDRVLAHGVFVYLPLTTTLGYLVEAVRVLRPGGLLVFDGFSEADLGFDQLLAFKRANPTYAFPVLLGEALLDGFARRYQLELLLSVPVPYHGITSTFRVYAKPSDSLSEAPAVAP